MTPPANVNSKDASSRLRDFVSSPNTLLGLTVAVVCVLLVRPLSLPIGPYYWDLYIYYDAANRIFSGQVPTNDFFSHVGPLTYYMFAGALEVFPNGQGLLLAQWSTLLVTAPLMAFVLWDVSKRSRVIALALLIPFLIFALLPFNTAESYPLPGPDGAGIYNRQCSQILYVILAAIIFMRRKLLLASVVTLGVSALFFIKFTGFLAGGLIAAYAILAGRFRWKYAVGGAIAFLLLLAGLEITSGVVGNHIRDILTLMEINSGTFLPFYVRAASQNIGITATAGMLAVLLLWADRRSLLSGIRSVKSRPSAVRIAACLDHPGFWLLVVLFAGLSFESQNVGGQALIFLWPVCLRVLTKLRRFNARPVLLATTATLIAATVLPSAVAVSERAVRTFVGSARNVPLQSENLRSLGAVTLRPDVALRAEHMLPFYPEHRATYDDFVAIRELPTPLLLADFDFQATYLANVDRAVGAIEELEAEKGVHFETIWSLNKDNPFPWLMNRRAPRAVPIGADSLRTVPPPGPEEQQAVAATDLVLYPTCPPLVVNADLLELYSSPLADHHRIELTDCYDAFVNPKYMPNLGD